MQIDLSGRAAVVTGSTQGIGLATAVALGRAGARVVLNGRSSARLAEALDRVSAAVPDATVTGHAADLGTPEGCAQLLREVPDADILVNNLGIFGPQDFFDASDENWRRFFEVNVMSGVRLARGYLPGMARRGWGRVVFVSSESALNIPADMIHYGVTKTANLSVSRGLAKRMAGTGVTVNAVLPGPTLSDGLADMLAEGHGDERAIADVAADFVVSERPTTLIRRAATVEEVASMIVYVASPQASATTGAALRVDGGVVDTIA